MKISVGMFTTKEDYCIIGYPKVHMFEYLIDSLRKQTYRDFELIIADALYEQRKDYFKDHKEKFEIKHVPMKPNIWLERGYWAISASRNTCILHATGDAVAFLGDAVAILPNYLETANELLNEYDSLNGSYAAYNGDDFISWIINPNTPTYDLQSSVCKMEWLEKANGYNEFYDGSKGWEDSDMPHRLKLMGAKMGFLPVPQIVQQHYGSQVITKTACCFVQREDVVKERYKNGNYVANKDPLSEEEQFFLKGCKRMASGACPAANRCHYPTTEDINLYLHPSFQFDLKEQRKDVNKAIEQLNQIIHAN